MKLSGSGLQDSLIDKSSGHFMVDAQEAGVGEVKVKIGGPKGKLRSCIIRPIAIHLNHVKSDFMYLCVAE